MIPIERKDELAIIVDWHFLVSMYTILGHIVSLSRHKYLTDHHEILHIIIGTNKVTIPEI